MFVICLYDTDTGDLVDYRYQDYDCKNCAREWQKLGYHVKVYDMTNGSLVYNFWC